MYLFLDRGEGKEKERVRNISMWLPLMCPLPGTWPQPRPVPWLGINLVTLRFAARVQSTELQPGEFSNFIILHWAFCYAFWEIPSTLAFNFYIDFYPQKLFLIHNFQGLFSELIVPFNVMQLLFHECNNKIPLWEHEGETQQNQNYLLEGPL